MTRGGSSGGGVLGGLGISLGSGGMTRGGMTYMLWVPKQFVELIFLLFFVIAENKHNKSECLIFAPAT